LLLVGRFEPDLEQRLPANWLSATTCQFDKKLILRGSGPSLDKRLAGRADQSWAMRDFTLFDPSGVLWRIAQNLPRPVG